MKRILTLLILTLAATSAAEGLHAQGLQSLLNLFANTKAAKVNAHAAGEPLTLEQLTASTWVYSSPQIVYSGSSSMATVAIATLRTQLPDISKALGLTTGSDAVTFLNNNTAVMQSGQHKGAVPYMYDPATGYVSFTITHKGTTAAFPATATARDGVLTVLFDANTSISTLLKMAPELKDNPSLVIIKAVADKYPGIKIGATFDPRPTTATDTQTSAADTLQQAPAIVQQADSTAQSAQ